MGNDLTVWFLRPNGLRNPTYLRLNSCAPGVTVVNIDNGFGAAMAAIKMMKK
jgi:NCAIR mutase (PurE)-related protein